MTAESQADAARTAAVTRTLRAEPRWPWLFAAIMLALHFGLATRNWHSGFLVGNEFRQTQTALTALFVQRTGDYGLAYPTPLFGPPWSIPMEFPLYQWSVASLATLTDWPIAESGRFVSLLFFYLALPAFYLLLRSLRCGRGASLIALGLTLAAPIHIFYSRAVLIESMALAFSSWFLLGYVRALQSRNVLWAALAILAGTAAALTKITSMLAWSVGALACTVLLIRRESGAGEAPAARHRRTLPVLLWSAACIIPAMCAGLAWVRFSDAIKANSPGGAWLQSGQLTRFNFGTWRDHFDPSVYAGWARHLGQGVAPLWIGAILLLAALIWDRSRIRPLLLTFGWVLIVLMTFPVLYAAHDYYFFAIAAIPLAGIGVMIGGWLEHRHRWLAPTLAVSLAGCQLASYALHYAPLQNVISNGGSGLTNFLRDMTPPESVLIVAGDDWASPIPYYAGRRSVMLRDDRVDDAPYLERVLESLGSEDVVAYIAVGSQRDNAGLRAKLGQRLDLARVLAISTPTADVYLAKKHFHLLLTRLIKYPLYDQVSVRTDPGPPPPDPVRPLVNDGRMHKLTPLQARKFFPGFTPVPYQYRSQFGLGQSEHDGRFVLGAHPDCEIWIAVPSGASRIDFSFGLPTATYIREGEKTDGARFTIDADNGRNDPQRIYDRLLDPANAVGDRGEQRVTLALPPATTHLVLRTGPNQTYSFDWAYWGHLEVK